MCLVTEFKSEAKLRHCSVAIYVLFITRAFFLAQCFDVIFISCFSLQTVWLCLWCLFSPCCISTFPLVIRLALVIVEMKPQKWDHTSTLIKAPPVSPTREYQSSVSVPMLCQRATWCFGSKHKRVVVNRKQKIRCLIRKIFHWPKWVAPHNWRTHQGRLWGSF